MFASKRGIISSSSNIFVITHHAPLAKLYLPSFFSSITHQGPTTPVKLSQKDGILDQGPTTPGKLSQKDGTLEGSEGGYGGSGISNTPHQTVERAKPGSPSTGNKARITAQTTGGDRRHQMEVGTEDAFRDVSEMAKAGVVGAMEVGLKFGETAKQVVDGMWDVAKKTTETTRDAVVDESDNKQTPGGRGRRGI